MSRFELPYLYVLCVHCTYTLQTHYTIIMSKMFKLLQLSGAMYLSGLFSKTNRLRLFKPSNWVLKKFWNQRA